MYELVVDKNVLIEKFKNRREAVEGKDISEKSQFPPVKPPRKFNKQLSADEALYNRMRTCSSCDGDNCLDVETINFEKSIVLVKKSDVSVQTSNLIPYRLRFWPRFFCEVKVGPKDRLCSKLGFFCVCKVISQWILSQFGLSLILLFWAAFGAYGFHITEGPREIEQLEKISLMRTNISKDLSIVLKQDINKTDDWSSQIDKYLLRHEKLLLEAVSAGFTEGRGRIWTYPGCILFAVSLLTTLGFGAPVPRTSEGRGLAVLFAAIGIPLHFLLIFNMANLLAVKLQKLAFKIKGSEDVSSPPKWLKWFPLFSIVSHYLLGVILFGFVRSREAVDSFMFPLDFTETGGVAKVSGPTKIWYAAYLEVSVTLAALVVSLIQASATKGLVDLCLKLGILTNT